MAWTPGKFDVSFDQFIIKGKNPNLENSIANARVDIQQTLSNIKSYTHPNLKRVVIKEMFVKHFFDKDPATDRTLSNTFHLELDDNLNIVNLRAIHRKALNVQENPRAKSISILEVYAPKLKQVQERVFYNYLHEIFDLPGHVLHVDRQLPDGSTTTSFVHDTVHSNERTDLRHTNKTTVDPLIVKRAFANLVTIVPDLQSLGLQTRSGIAVFETGLPKGPYMGVPFGYNNNLRIVNLLSTLPCKETIQQVTNKPTDVRIELTSNDTFHDSITSVTDRVAPMDGKFVDRYKLTNPDYLKNPGDVHPERGHVYYKS